MGKMQVNGPVEQKESADNFRVQKSKQGNCEDRGT